MVLVVEGRLQPCHQRNSDGSRPTELLPIHHPLQEAFGWKRRLVPTRVRAQEDTGLDIERDHTRGFTEKLAISI